MLRVKEILERYKIEDKFSNKTLYKVDVLAENISGDIHKTTIIFDIGLQANNVKQNYIFTL